ncbi:hypothetical protein ElyMa_006776800 [Elysia marginata]|uniref:Uncharacterized protein n=1 Tax=Elysia marginata TaxID=1093978 RepID=A0AAV4IZ22_9GAST|nr:hypothetical protein ElyMa_006776800 [Elysia marginata]
MTASLHETEFIRLRKNYTPCKTGSGSGPGSIRKKWVEVLRVISLAPRGVKPVTDLEWMESNWSLRHRLTASIVRHRPTRSIRASLSSPVYFQFQPSSVRLLSVDRDRLDVAIFDRECRGRGWVTMRGGVRAKRPQQWA